MTYPNIPTTTGAVHERHPGLGLEAYPADTHAAFLHNSAADVPHWRLEVTTPERITLTPLWFTDTQILWAVFAQLEKQRRDADALEVWRCRQYHNKKP